jgi:norsolorinic acid ketoreductase
LAIGRRQPPVANGVYGPSKSMLNWYGVRINAEDEWLTTFILDPGWVQTEMGNKAAQLWGMDEAPDKLDDSVDGMFKVLTTATKEAFGGKIVSYGGEVLGW